MSSANFASLYSSGDLILENPIQSSSVFLMIVVVCASIEYLFSLADQVDSKFFREMFDTISEEVLVIGVLSLLLTFGSSLVGSLPSQWSVMFDWAHICLLFMGIMLVLLLCLVIANVFSASARWTKFESDRIRQSPETHSSREQRYRIASEKFKFAVRAYGFTGEVFFTHYIHKAEKEGLIALGNLSWKSWMALSTIVVLNALRTKVVPQDSFGNLDSTGNLINIASYVAIAGYGTLALFVAVHLRLQLRFRQYLMLNSNAGGNGGAASNSGGEGTELTASTPLDANLVPSKSDLDDPLSFLLWQSQENSIAMVQAVLMFLVWYAAVFCLNMVYASFTLPNIGLTLLIVCVAIAPIVVFVVIVPWTLTTIAILSSLGTNLREDWVKALLAKAALEAPEEVAAAAAAGNKDPASGEETSRVAKVQIKASRPVLLDEAAMQRLAQSMRQHPTEL